MAKASAKKQTQANIQALKNLHLASLIINFFYLISFLFLHRPQQIKPFLIFSLPAWILEYQLEKIGRPKFFNGQLISPGSDLNQQGLTEYLFDVIYVTWGCDLLAILIGKSWVWSLYLVIPSYGSYAVYTGFIQPLLKQQAALSGGSGRQQVGDEDGSSSALSKKDKKKKEKVKYVR
ncbi:DUF788-domain-containing protein [Lipomyces japonicus]|uniref:DUF788-domain-containing protein n=1 Tax=Lipomyces japonicus TaxID=56871 RepID=UPI0034CD78E2